MSASHISWAENTDLMTYSGHVSGIYRGKRRNEVPPHIFAIAEGSYGSMCLSKFSSLDYLFMMVIRSHIFIIVCPYWEILSTEIPIFRQLVNCS